MKLGICHPEERQGGILFVLVLFSSKHSVNKDNTSSHKFGKKEVVISQICETQTPLSNGYIKEDSYNRLERYSYLTEPCNR